MDEQKMLTAMANDRMRQCSVRNRVTHTDFLSPEEQSVLRQARLLPPPGVRMVFCGGFDGAEREIAVFLPDYAEEDDEEVRGLLSVIRADCSEKAHASSSGRAPGHGDYLGSLLGLGISRGVVGDILVREDGADILVLADIADYIVQNYRSAGRAALSVSRHDVADLIVPAGGKQEQSCSVASLRLDSVVSAAFGVPRARAQEAIRSGLVFVDHILAEKPDIRLEDGSLIAVRHRGRVRITEIGGTSRKGRIHLTIERQVR